MWDAKYNVVETLEMGDTRMRLGRSVKGKYIVELWSSLSEMWRVTHRESDAFDQWTKWKETALAVS